MIKFIKYMLLDESEKPSTKKVQAFIALFVAIAVSMYAVVKHADAIDYTMLFLSYAATCLGMGTWQTINIKNSKNQNQGS